MKTAVIGARGQLGSDLCARLAGDVTGLDLPEFDVRQADRVAAALAEIRPDVVVNCAALTNVDACEDRIDQAFAVNSLGASHVARVAEQHGAAVVYISTDYVFGRDTRRSQPYTEDDPTGPVNVYGASKLAGEHLTAIAGRRWTIVRTCGLYGLAGAAGKGGNFVETMLRLADEDKPLRVVSDQRVSPTSTWELAGKIAELIQVGPCGLVHVAAIDSCSWHAFAQGILDRERPGVSVEPIRSDQYETRAKRPALSALTGTRLMDFGIEPCRPWRDMLHEYLDARRQRVTTRTSQVRQAQ
ncbi:MAG TPA: dTDP-4-dehydrorhamnose reductase [Phycisphaerae bacterium]|nr:dTDP-4-dehydrorhamnose reductase [Phycisphaerae bacterium]